MDFEKRLVSVDVVRGIAIIGVLFIHATIFGIWHTETNALNVVPISIIAIFIPIILMGTWGGGFPLISSLVGTYNVYRRMDRGISLRKACIPILINSTILLLLDPLKSFLIGRTWTTGFTEGTNYSLLSSLLEKGEFILPGVERIMQIGSLSSIGLSGYLTVLLLWLLFRKDGKEKIKRNIMILITLGLSLIIASNFINEALHPYVEILYMKGGIFAFFAYILRLFVSAQLSFFPISLYGIFGIIPGYLFAMKKDFKWIKRYGFGLGSLFLGGFILTTTLTLVQASDIEAGLFGILDYEIYPRELLFLSLGCMLFILVWLAKKFEYTSYEKKVLLARRTLFIRRFGVASLTIYFFEPFFNNIFANAFHRIFGDISAGFGNPDPFMSNVPAILLYELVLFSFWGLAVYYWSKSGYKFGLEHAIIVISRPFRKVKTMRSHLYNPSNEEVEEARRILGKVKGKTEKKT
ncbi:hypothetical protein ES705_24052 [subsurface metagenome]